MVEPQNRKGGLKDMAQGTVKSFSTEKGYGFITPLDGSETELTSDE